MSRMSRIWFDSLQGPDRSWGEFFFRSGPDGLWGVLVMNLVYPDDLRQESEQVLGHLGGAVNAIGVALLQEGIAMPQELHQWIEAPDRPAAELGGWLPELICIDDTTLLCLARVFSTVRIVATLYDGAYVAAVAPAATTLTFLTCSS